LALLSRARAGLRAPAPLAAAAAVAAPAFPLAVRGLPARRLRLAPLLPFLGLACLPARVLRLALLPALARAALLLRAAGGEERFVLFLPLRLDLVGLDALVLGQELAHGDGDFGARGLRADQLDDPPAHRRVRVLHDGGQASGVGEHHPREGDLLH